MFSTYFKAEFELHVANAQINIRNICMLVNVVDFMMAYIIFRTYMSVNVVILNTNIYHNIAMCKIRVNMLVIVYVH